MDNNAKINAKEVAWSGGKPLMYQYFLEAKVNEERTIRICGYPKPTESLAKDALRTEFELWEKAMKAFRSKLNEK